MWAESKDGCIWLWFFSEFNKWAATHLDWAFCSPSYHTNVFNNMVTCAGTSISAMIYRQVLEQTEASSLPPQGKLEVTFGIISFLHPLMVLKNWNGTDWCSDNTNAPLKMAVISAVTWSSDHSVENYNFPTRPAVANLVRVSPLGIMKADVSDVTVVAKCEVPAVAGGVETWNKSPHFRCQL